MGFDIERYVELSRALDTTDLDWRLAAEASITPVERRCLGYFAAVESYTVVYLRDLLNTRVIEDADVAAFLPCWVYEETHHGRALHRFLDATAGGDPTRIAPLPLGRRTLREHVTALGATVLGAITRHLLAVHMTWGALVELVADAAYGRLQATTRNPVLRELLARIRRDERRHLAFYYDQAARRLEHRAAQRLTRLVLATVWTPAGGGIAEREEIDTAARALFLDARGRELARGIDARIARLPGLAQLRPFETALARIAGE